MIEVNASARSARWYVVGSLAGLRCEEHIFEPDNALSGPYKNDGIAFIAMQRMLKRDRWELLISWVLIGGFSLTFAGWLVWKLAGGGS